MFCKKNRNESKRWAEKRIKDALGYSVSDWKIRDLISERDDNHVQIVLGDGPTPFLGDDARASKTGDLITISGSSMENNVEEGGSYKLGDATIVLKENSDSRFGYTVVSAEYSGLPW